MINALSSRPATLSPTDRRSVSTAGQRRAFHIGKSGGSSSDPRSIGPQLFDIARELESDRAALDAAIRRAEFGGRFRARDLIALQLSVYRYAETMDVVSRVVDRSVSAAKTLLQSQV